MRNFGARLVLAAAIAGAAAGAGGEEVKPELLGRTIESVAFTCDGPADRPEIESLVDLHAGRPLTLDDTGATIQNLFATLDFSNVLVAAEPTADGGVAVTIHLWRSYRVARIAFDGKSSLSREDMRRAVVFSERDPFNGIALAEGASALERKLAADGYVHADVSPEATFEADTFSVDVVYRIAAGERSRVATPYFDGKVEPFTPQELLANSKLKVGSPYRESRVRAGAERLRKYLLDQGRFKAIAELIAAEPTEDGGIRPVYRLNVGPPYVVEATGIKQKQARKEILALLEGQGLDEDLLEQWANTTREALQRAGRYRAKVTAVAMGTDPVTVKLAVDAGAKYAVEKVALAGNASVSDETLRALIVTRPRGLPLLQKGRLVDGDLEADASAVLGYYQTHGWISAKVDKPAVTEGSKPDLLDVAITIVEGPRTFVASRRVEGVEHLTPPEIDALVVVREGEPFNPSAVPQDVAALTSRYWNTGWREAAVRDRWTLSPDKTKVDVIYTVDEGMRSFFGKTILRGNAVTDPGRILRQVAWKEGDPYSEEKIADTQKNLARAGVFRSIEVRPQPVNPASEEHNVDINLTEARRISLLYGVGYQYAGSGTSNPNDPFVTLGISYRNLFGRMQSASFEVQYAPLTQRGYVVANFLEPYLFNTDVPLTFGVFASREPIQLVDINRFGVFFESARQIGPLRMGLRYSYQQIAPTNPADLGTIVLEKFPRSAFPIKQSAIGPSFLYDQRDDVLNPHKGYYVTVAGNYAFPFLNADAWYGKASGQAAYFVSVLGGVIAASVRVGGLFPANADAEKTVPIAEKFFAGGSSTARGFDTDLEGIPAVTVDYNAQATLKPASQAGVGSCDSPTYVFPMADPALYNCSPGPRIIGGNGFMAMGLEYRLPIFGNLGVSVFYDLAQVWTTPGQIRLGLEGPAGLRQSVGAGLHYVTPIGPLRLEYGRPVQLRTITSEVTTTEGTLGGLPCGTEHPCILGSLKTKETGRVLLSIGYPF